MYSEISIILKAKQRKIESLESDPLCSEFLSQLKSSNHIDFLCLSGNSYSDNFFKELAPYLAKMIYIKKVVLSDIFTTRKHEILPSLKILNECLQNKQMVLFDISSNAICPDGCLEIVDILKTNQTLKYLLLNHVALSEAGTMTIANALIEGKLNLKSLQVIKNRIENQAHKLAEAIENMSDLEELIIYQNSIKKHSMTALLNSIVKCKNLVHLDIADNHVSEEQSQLLAIIFASHQKLEKIKIDDCNINYKGTKIIIEAIRKSEFKNLVEFSYNYNEIENLEELVFSLQTLPNIKVIQCKGADNNKLTAVPSQLNIVFESEDEESDDQAKLEEINLKKMIEEIKRLKL